MRTVAAYIFALGTVLVLASEAAAQPVPRQMTYRDISVTCPPTVSGVSLKTVPNEDVGEVPEGWSLPEQGYGYGGVILNVGSINAYATQVTCNYVLRKTSTPPAKYTMVRIVKDYPGGSCRVDQDRDFTAICSVPNTSPVIRPAIPRERIKKPGGN